MKFVVIVGAGITGCVIASELVRKGYKVVIVESSSDIGGLAKTFRYGDFSFDVGPHRFFTQKQEISNYISSVLKDDYAIIPRHSEVHFLGKYHAWPLRPTVLFNLPLSMTLKSAWELFLMSINNKKKDVLTFEEYTLMNYGPSLYNVFFKDYTEKFLGSSPKKIHSEWAKEGMKRTIIDERIGSRNLLDILRLFFMFRPLKTEFIYPAQGIGLFCRRLAEGIVRGGGEIHTDASVSRVRYAPGKIEEIFIGETGFRPDMVVWTGPLGPICNLLELSCKGLNYLSLILFNIEIARPINKSYQWCYYGDREIVFSRVTIPSLFNKNMAPEGKAGLCVEVTVREGDRWWNDPEALVERVKKDLFKVDLIDRSTDIENIHIEKIKDAYPIYAIDYPEDLKKVREDLGKTENLVLAGRTGLFWYNNMDDCVENAMETAKDIIKG